MRQHAQRHVCQKHSKDRPPGMIENIGHIEPTDKIFILTTKGTYHPVKPTLDSVSQAKEDSDQDTNPNHYETLHAVCEDIGMSSSQHYINKQNDRRYD